MTKTLSDDKFCNLICRVWFGNLPMATMIREFHSKGGFARKASRAFKLRFERVSVECSPHRSPKPLFPLRCFWYKRHNTNPQCDFLHGRFPFSIAKEQHALLRSDHEASGDGCFVFEYWDAVRSFEDLLITLLWIHVENVQPLRKLSAVPPNHLTISATRKELWSGLAVDPQHRIYALAMTNFTRRGANTFGTGASVPCATLAIWLPADKDVYVTLVILDANWGTCGCERVERLIRVFRFPNVRVQRQPRIALLEIRVAVSNCQLKAPIWRPRQVADRTLKVWKMS